MIKAKSKPRNRKDVIYDQLAALGIRTIRITYDGVDDSGCIENVTAYGDSDTVVPLPDGHPVTYTFESVYYDLKLKRDRRREKTATLPIAEAVSQWCYDLLAENFEGWGDNEGSFGTVTFDVPARTTKLHHEARFIETELTELEV